MTAGNTTYLEASVPVGAVLVTIGCAVIAAHFAFAVFTSWAWAIPIGGLWILGGLLLCFGDVRLYQFDRSPIEQLLVAGEGEQD